MKIGASTGGSTRIALTVLALATGGCASSGNVPAGAGDIYRIKKIVEPTVSRDSAAASTGFVQVFQPGPYAPGATRTSVSARRGMTLADDDSLFLSSQWRTRLRLNAGGADWSWAVLAPELMTARGDTVLAPWSSPPSVQYSIGRSEGHTVLDVHGGAVVMTDRGHEGSEAICVRAVGWCALGSSDASYALGVDSRGVASLFVASGNVRVAKASSDLVVTCRSANPRPDVACEEPDEPGPVLPGAVWSWSDTTPPAERKGVGRLEIDRLENAVQYNGVDLWKERSYRWAPWLLIPAAVVGCLATDFWICGDDSVSGTVIVVRR